jgi:uncharacterized protein YjbJ (UPF0337 family)
VQFACHKEKTMSSTTDKIKGVANEAAGSAKEGVGKAVGSDKLRAEGAAQNLKGHAEKAVGDTKDAVKKVADKAIGQAHKDD